MDGLGVEDFLILGGEGQQRQRLYIGWWRAGRRQGGGRPQKEGGRRRGGARRRGQGRRGAQEAGGGPEHRVHAAAEGEGELAEQAGRLRNYDHGRPEPGAVILCAPTPQRRLRRNCSRCRRVADRDRWGRRLRGPTRNLTSAVYRTCGGCCDANGLSTGNGECDGITGMHWGTAQQAILIRCLGTSECKTRCNKPCPDIRDFVSREGTQPAPAASATLSKAIWWCVY